MKASAVIASTAMLVAVDGCRCDETERGEGGSSTATDLSVRPVLSSHVCDSWSPSCAFWPDAGPSRNDAHVVRLRAGKQSWWIELGAHAGWHTMLPSDNERYHDHRLPPAAECATVSEPSWSYCLPLSQAGVSVQHEVIAKRRLTGTIRRERESPITLEPVMLSRELHGPKLYGMPSSNRVLDIQMARMSEDRSLYAALFDDPDDPPEDPDWGESGFTIWVVVWRLDDDEGKLVTTWEVGTRAITTHYDLAQFVGERYFVALLDAQLHVFDLKTRYTWTPCERSSIAVLPAAGVDDVRGVLLSTTGGQAQLIDVGLTANEKGRCHFVDLPRHGNEAGSSVSSVALSRDGVGAAIDGRGEVVLFETARDRVVSRFYRSPPAYYRSPAGGVDNALWFSRDGRWLFYLSGYGLDILNRATQKWLTLVPLEFDSVGLLALDDDGHVDGDPEVLERIPFRVGDRLVMGLDGVRAAGGKSPHVPGLLQRFVAEEETDQGKDGGAHP